MEMEMLNKLTGNDSLTIVDAMGKIDQNSKGILFITDQNGILQGALTDGDIRRWLMNSGEITASVTNAMNSSPISLQEERKSDAFKIMNKKQITALPLIDCEKKVVDVVFLSDSEKPVAKGKLKDIPVVVMAGGKGTRLYPYTKILPKPLVPIGDTPIVERIIDYYTDFGMDKFYLTVNYKKNMIRSYFEDINRSYEITYVEEDKPLGTGGSIKLIDDEITRPFFITNCDALILADYYDIYQYHLKSENDITMVSALKNYQVPYGVMHTGSNGILESMEEKPKLSYFINTGMYIINPSVIELIPDNVMFHMTNLVEKVMEKGGKVGTYPVSEDSFLDMGEFDEMKRMEEKLGIITSKEREI